MDNVETTTPEQELKVDALMGKKLYSIRAKFYDKYNVRRDIDYDIEHLIFNKLDALQAENKKLKEQQLTEDEIVEILLKQECGLNWYSIDDEEKELRRRVSEKAKAIIKAREAKIKEIENEN